MRRLCRTVSCFAFGLAQISHGSVGASGRTSQACRDSLAQAVRQAIMRPELRYRMIRPVRLADLLVVFRVERIPVLIAEARALAANDDHRIRIAVVKNGMGDAGAVLPADEVALAHR